MFSLTLAILCKLIGKMAALTRPHWDRGIWHVPKYLGKIEGGKLGINQRSFPDRWNIPKENIPKLDG